MHTYWVAYEVESVGQMFQKRYQLSHAVTLRLPVGDEDGRGEAELRSHLVRVIDTKLGFECQPGDIYIASLTHLHSRPNGNAATG